MKKMLLMFMVSLFVMSCSRIPEEREVTASGVEVSGFIKDYIEVVDGSYKFTNNGEEGRVTVKLKLKEQPTEAYHETSFPKIRINAVGANGEIFDTGVYGFEAGDKEFDKVKDLLANGKVGDTKSISLLGNISARTKIWARGFSRRRPHSNSSMPALPQERNRKSQHLSKRRQREPKKVRITMLSPKSID